jgi:tRNA 2-thiouridine synthesizing protein A
MVERTILNAVARWDAGETGCSQLIVGLNRRLTQLNPGDLLEVVARDMGAPIDVYVWCRMTGHRLLSEAHPVYLIQRRGD